MARKFTSTNKASKGSISYSADFRWTCHTMWVNVLDTSVDNQFILLGGAGIDMRYPRYISNAISWSNSSSGELLNQGAISQAAWHFIGIIRSPSDGVLDQIDGWIDTVESDNISTVSLNTGNTQNLITIGNSSTDNFLIQDLAWWGGNSSASIPTRANMRDLASKAQRPNTIGLQPLLYYKCDEVGAGTIIDYGSLANDLAITGSVPYDNTGPFDGGGGSSAKKTYIFYTMMRNAQ